MSTDVVTVYLSSTTGRKGEADPVFRGVVIAPERLTRPEVLLAATLADDLPPAIAMRIEEATGLGMHTTGGRMAQRVVVIRTTWIVAVDQLTDPGFRL